MGDFYPEGTSSKQLLRFYADRFDTVEVNMTFYRYPTSNAVAKWREETDEDFLFAVKLNRLITHFQKLKGTTDSVRSFLAVLEGLGRKLGPILIQLPPQLDKDLVLLDSLGELPNEHKYAVEFRHPSWFTEGSWRTLEKHRVAACLIDSNRLQLRDVVTAPFAYIRWHGKDGKRQGNYSRDDLREWASIIDDLDVDEVFGYFNNDVGGHAPRNCQDLRGMLPPHCFR